MKLTPLVAVWSLRTFTRKQIERALKSANRLPWSHKDGWHPANDTVLDATGSRTKVGVLDWSPTRKAWSEHLASLKATHDPPNVLKLPRPSARREA